MWVNLNNLEMYTAIKWSLVCQAKKELKKMHQFLLLEGKKWTATKEPLEEVKDENEKLTWNTTFKN